MYRQSEKNLLSSNISSTCPHNMVNFIPLAAEIVSLVWGTPANFNGFGVLAALLHGTLVVGVSQTLHRWTEGATYIRQGGHHVGHWPTFLVLYFIECCKIDWFWLRIFLVSLIVFIIIILIFIRHCCLANNMKFLLCDFALIISVIDLHRVALSWGDFNGRLQLFTECAHTVGFYIPCYLVDGLC